MENIVRYHIQRDTGIQDVEVEVPVNSSFGHYSTNIALRLAKEKGKNPLDLAREIAKSLESDLFEKIEVKEPGFINFWISRKILFKGLEDMERLGMQKAKIGKGKTVIVEYPSINIAKPAHIGHLRSGVIGSALANIYEVLGYKVVRWDYVGDWGTQFGKLIAAYKMWGSKKEVKEAPIETLLQLYVKFHDEVRNKPELEAMGQSEFAKLEKGDRENRKLWQWFKDESMKEFDRAYKRLGFKVDVSIGEAFFEKDLKKINQELKKSIAKESEGAWIVPLEEQDLPPALVEKSDGSSLYLTRDLALLKYRIKKYNPDKILHVVANEQALHFSQVFAVSELLGITKVKPVHVKFGMVLGEDGKKFSTREGKAVQLEVLVDKIVSLARKAVEEKNPDLPDKEKDEISEIVGIGALKYNDLKENRNSDIIFNWDKMLDFTGDSAPYLQYTCVRLKNILKKAGKIKKHDLNFLTEEVEISLTKKIQDFEDILDLCAENYLTSYLAKYLYDLGKMANKFYENIRVLEDENEKRRNARLLLIKQTLLTLGRGLEILGIKVPKRI